MKSAELKPIVAAWGGPEKFAAIIGVKSRIVYYWLSDDRKMSEPTDKLIRSLKPKHKTKGVES
jgi:hypothetical protein